MELVETPKASTSAPPELGGADDPNRYAQKLPDALVIVEEAQGTEVSLPERFEEIERRDYGETKVVFGRFMG